LARICVSEAGFQTDTNDCAAIHQVLDRRKRSGSLLRIMRLYSSRAFDRTRDDSRRWVSWLHLGRRAPRGWPARTPSGARHPEWLHFRPLWRNVLEHAANILRGEVGDPCQQRPDHWGSRYGIDLERARRAGWEEVDCGPTSNAFWRVPRAQ
jgi:hypothetical protein